MALLKHDNLSMEELIHYGSLGQVDGLSSEIAERFNSYLDTTQAGIDDRMANEIEELKEIIDEVREAVG